MISKELSATLGFAVKEAKKRRHEYVSIEHILFAILNDPNGPINGLLQSLGLPTVPFLASPQLAWLAAVLAEAWEKLPDLPGLMWHYLPALIETINIAAVSTLAGVLLGFVFAMHGTRGLALWPWAVPVFRRITDVMRAVPEIVIDKDTSTPEVFAGGTADYTIVVRNIGEAGAGLLSVIVIWVLLPGRPA